MRALRDLRAVDGLDPIEAGRRRPRLVRLQRSDEVPLDVVDVGQFVALAAGFLDVVLAEGALAQSVHCTYRVSGKRLRDGQQAHGARRPAGALARGLDALARDLPLFLVSDHNRPRIRTSAFGT